MFELRMQEGQVILLNLRFVTLHVRGLDKFPENEPLSYYKVCSKTFLLCLFQDT
jgi:hypothetical protein